MTEVHELLSAYIVEHRREGRADPSPYLEAVGGADRAELAALIDHFLATAERQPFDAAAFERFRSRPEVVEMSQRIVRREPATLVGLRRRAGVTKQALGEHLARDLGVEGDAAQAKACYHDLETGAVNPERVRQGVWDSLATAFGEAAANVRGAAAPLAAPRTEGVFARTDPAASPGTQPLRRDGRTEAQRRVDEAFFR